MENEKKPDQYQVRTWDLTEEGVSYRITGWMNEVSNDGFCLMFEEVSGNRLTVFMVKRRGRKLYRIKPEPQKFMLKMVDDQGKTQIIEATEIL